MYSNKPIISGKKQKPKITNLIKLDYSLNELY